MFQRYSTVQTCEDKRCDRYCGVTDCFPSNIVCQQGKPCATYICNNEKLDTMNKKIFDRMMGDCPRNVVPDYRPEFKNCGGASYTDKNIIPMEYRQLQNHITDFRCLPNCFEPGEGNKLTYLRQIDVDSHLKRYDKPATLCDPLKHQRPPCTDFMPDPEPTIGHRDVFSRSQRGTGALLCEVPTDSQVPIRYIDAPNSCGSKPFPMVDVNIIRSTPKQDPCFCGFEPIRMTDENVGADKKFNVLTAATHTIDRIDKPVLILGPERCDKGKITNLWHNNTSRKMMSDTLEHYY
jgi:hypothetical protein